MLKMFRAEVPKMCLSKLKSRDFDCLYRFVKKEDFDETDFLSPAEENPSRLNDPNADICGLFGVSMGTLEYCHKQRKKYKKLFRNMKIAKGSIKATEAKCVCDFEPNYFHVDIYPLESSCIEKNFELLAENEQEV